MRLLGLEIIPARVLCYKIGFFWATFQMTLLPCLSTLIPFSWPYFFCASVFDPNKPHFFIIYSLTLIVSKLQILHF